jgi:6-phosphogluconolactonase
LHLVDVGQPGGTPITISHAPLPGAACLAWHPWEPVVYAATPADGLVVAFRVGGDGSLEQIGTEPSGGAEPCSIVVSADGAHLVVANYSAGNVGVLNLGSGGELGSSEVSDAPAGSGPRRPRQASPHLHQVLHRGQGSALWIVDLGADRLLELDTRDRRRKLETSALLRPGSGPRHVSWVTDGRLAVVEELASSLSVFDEEPGGLRLRGSTAATHESGVNYPSDLAVGGNSGVVYIANRGADTIGVVDVRNQPMLVQELKSGGRWPQNLELRPDGLWCAFRDSNEVQRIPVDPISGLLGQPDVIVSIERPMWLEQWRLRDARFELTGVGEERSGEF